MVGGSIIENKPWVLPWDGSMPDAFTRVRRIWCVDRNGDECAVYAEPAAEVLEPGEQIWWQSGTIYARHDKLTFKKMGFSFDPRKRQRGR